MSQVLVLHAHPDPTRSRVNGPMLDQARSVSEITVVDLYAEYPRFKIDIDREQRALVDHDVVVLQFPVYWYSTPALLKEWQDQVLEYGFAYGPNGDRLCGKRLLLACTAGGAREAYQPDGSNRFTLRALLAPLEQTATLCRMSFLTPLVMFSALRANEADQLAGHLEVWRRMLVALRDDTELPEYPSP